MLDRLNDYDWGHVFEYAAPTLALESSPVPLDPFTRDDVAEIIAIVDGENEGADWVGVFRLNDARYAVLRAGCDYTGWGCGEGGSSEVASSLPHLIRYALTNDERDRLGLALDEAPPC